MTGEVVVPIITISMATAEDGSRVEWEAAENQSFPAVIGALECVLLQLRQQYLDGLGAA